MSKFRSIKAKSIVYTLLIMLVPVVILGVIGTLYYHDVIRQNVQNDYTEEARTIGALTASFLDRSSLELELQAERSTLVNALEQRNIAVLDDQVEKINDASTHFYWIYVTDASGRVLSSSLFGSLAGKDMSDNPYIAEPLRTGKTVAGPPTQDVRTGRLTVYVGTPVMYNDTVAGVLVGALDEGQFADILESARSLVPLQSIYIVNRSGMVVFSHNQSDVVSGTDLSSVTAAQQAVQGREGFDDRASISGKGEWMVAYAPVQGRPLGVLIAVPCDVIDGPIENATAMMALAVLVLAALATSLAIVIGGYITRPITRISEAAERYTPGMDLGKYLPYDRDDELGQLARAFASMSERIMKAREKIIGEKKRSDMYVDVMGHDINNLNQVILSNLDLIRQTGSLDDRQQQFLDGARQAVGDSADIVRNVEAIQAATAEALRPRPIDLGDALQECIAEAPRPGDRQVSFRYQPRKGLIAYAVPGIRRAFGNVIGEAIRNAGPAVDIDIDVSEATAGGKRMYVTTISDNGPGIPEDARKTLFTRFQQGSPVPPGKGLGLYAAKVLAEASGGTISVEDRVPGDYTRGTKVVITLPAAGNEEGS